MSFLNVHTNCQVRFVSRSNRIYLALGTQLTPYGMEIKTDYVPDKNEEAIFQIEVTKFNTTMVKGRVEIVKKGSFFIRFLNVWKNEEGTKEDKEQDFLFVEELKKQTLA